MHPLLASFGVPDVLFARDSLSLFLGGLMGQLDRDVSSWPTDEFLRLSEAEIVEHLVAEYSRECPVLETTAIYVLDIDHQVERAVPTGLFRNTVTVRQTEITIVVPFAGDAELFQWRPMQFSSTPPRAQIHDGELYFRWEGTGGDPAQIRTSADLAIGEVQRWLGWSGVQIGQHNRRVAEQAHALVASRRARLLADRNLRAGIGFPLRRRDEAQALHVPITRRRISARPTPTGPGTQPEPAMRDEDYDAAIGVLVNLRNALERSPSTVKDMGEEDIRNWLLVGLNGQFEGQAAGEVFNNTGKTDILIRVQDRHIFIGECKIWRGPKTIPTTLDQLLSYLTWRDTKAALLLFIRSGSPTEVIAKAVDKIREHPNYKRDTGGDTEDRHNFIFHANGDPEREIRLAFLPFHLPRAGQDEQAED